MTYGQLRRTAAPQNDYETKIAAEGMPEQGSGQDVLDVLWAWGILTWAELRLQYLNGEGFLVLVGCDVDFQGEVRVIGEVAPRLQVTRFLQRITGVTDQLSDEHLQQSSTHMQSNTDQEHFPQVASSQKKIRLRSSMSDLASHWL